MMVRSIYLVPMLLAGFLLSGCNTFAAPPVPSTAPAISASTARATPIALRPDWFNMPLTDVQTGKAFKINDFAGKVALIETMAQWCPNCLFQQGETRTVRKLLGNPQDLILISLDIDSHEDAATLKKYTGDFGFDWRFAVTPLEVARALGNLYSAEYLNPPLDPMLLIDRSGNVHTLPYGEKNADTLQKILEPYLAK